MVIYNRNVTSSFCLRRCYSEREILTWSDEYEMDIVDEAKSKCTQANILRTLSKRLQRLDSLSTMFYVQGAAQENRWVTLGCNYYRRFVDWVEDVLLSVVSVIGNYRSNAAKEVSAQRVRHLYTKGTIDWAGILVVGPDLGITSSTLKGTKTKTSKLQG